MGNKRIIVPTSAIDISKAKVKAGNVSTVVNTDELGEVFYRIHGAGEAGRGGFVVNRLQHVKKDHKLGHRAQAMKSCGGGGKGSACTFKKCLETAGFNPPRSIKKACPA